MTLDIFKDYDPGPVVERFAPEEIKGFSPAMKLAKAIGQALIQSDLGRDEIAERMSDIARDRVSKQMLDNYASPSKEHHISAARLVALTMVLDDIRPLNALLAEAGLIVVPERYELLLRRERAREIADKASRDAAAADAEWRAKR